MNIHTALIAREGTAAAREAAEFNAEVFDWEARLARVDGDVLDEFDFPVFDEVDDGWDRPTDDEWEWFREQMFSD